MWENIGTMHEPAGPPGPATLHALAKTLHTTQLKVHLIHVRTDHACLFTCACMHVRSYNLHYNACNIIYNNTIYMLIHLHI